MQLSTWRTSLKTWLTSKVVIDDWHLDTPDKPGVTVGFLPPIRDLHYDYHSNVEVKAEGTQEFYMLKMYDPALTYDQLPIAQLEGFYQTLALKICHDFKDIADDLTGLEMNTVDRPVTVKELADERREWLIELRWSFRISFIALPETGTTQKPFPLTRIITGLHRSLLPDPSFVEQEVLDARWSELVEMP